MKMPSLLVLISVSFVLRSVSADEPDLEKSCAEAAKSMKQIEGVAAFKLHGVTKNTDSTGVTQHEVWLEGRNGKYWCQTLSVGENDKIVEKEIRLAEVANADRKATKIFDGKSSIQHYPIKMLVVVNDAESFVAAGPNKYLIPVSWTSFSQSIHPGKYTYRYVLENSLQGRSVKLMPNENKIRVTIEHQPATSFKFKWLEFSPTNSLVTASNESGGTALAHTAEYDWEMSNGVWYVSKGKVQLGEKVQFEWKIDSYSSDAKHVRQSFGLEESKLPLGTRIEEDPQGKRGARKIRFVGGAEGQREHDLRQEALKVALIKWESIE